MTLQYDTATLEGKADQLMEEIYSAIYDKLCPNGDRVQEPRTEGETLHEALCDVTLGFRKILLEEEELDDTVH